VKADLISLDAVGAERAPGSETGGRSEKALMLLAGTGLAMVGCGVVAAVLWLVWLLAEVIP
jgi:hypothetical protein